MTRADVLCFGTEWDLEGPHQHLLPRCAQTRRVFFIEEARLVESRPFTRTRRIAENLWAVRPHLPADASLLDQHRQLRAQLTLLALDVRIVLPVLWYMRADPAAAMAGAAASLVICGPVPVHEQGAMNAWRPLLEQADVIVPELNGASAQYDELFRGFWDVEESTVRTLPAVAPRAQPAPSRFANG
jgi:hypothetical protein